MTLRELLTKIRIEKGYTFRDLADKLDESAGRISDTEKGKISISENLLKAYMEEFPLYKSKLLKAYTEEKIPVDLKEQVEVVLKNKENKNKRGMLEAQKLKIYTYDSGKSGELFLNEYKEVNIMTEAKISDDDIVIEVKNKYIEPYFLEGDTLLFEFDDFTSWEALNKKLIAVRIKDKTYIRKLIFKNAVPYLVAFNSEVYPDIKIDNTAIYLCQLSELLERKNIKGIEFE